MEPIEMKITGIGEDNLSYFQPFLLEAPVAGTEAVGLIMDGEAAGAALIFIDDSICFLRNLYIGEPYRRRGGGSFLLAEIIRVMKNLQISDLFFCFGEDEGLSAFLRSRGFVCAPSLPVFSFSVKALLESRAVSMLSGSPPREEVVPFSDVDREAWQDMQSRLPEYGFAPSLLTPGSFDPEISYAVCSRGVIRGMILVRREDDDFYVPLLLSGETDRGIFFSLSRVFFQMLNLNRSRESRIFYLEHNPRLTEDLRRFLPQDDGLRSEGNTWTGLLRL